MATEVTRRARRKVLTDRGFIKPPGRVYSRFVLGPVPPAPDGIGFCSRSR